MALMKFLCVAPCMMPTSIDNSAPKSHRAWKVALNRVVDAVSNETPDRVFECEAQVICSEVLVSRGLLGQAFIFEPERMPPTTRAGTAVRRLKSMMAMRADVQAHEPPGAGHMDTLRNTCGEQQQGARGPWREFTDITSGTRLISLRLRRRVGADVRDVRRVTGAKQKRLI
ncbi:MAG: hypothetical protein IPG34_19385 [Rhodocyclaceae bacterium]|nr:hypothetical protein [Rhodocyclaceae bacterium]